MQKDKIIKIAVCVGIAILLLCIYTCKSKAEDEHHYTSDFETPDPYADVYDVIESDNPIITFEPNFTFTPIDPIGINPTSAPDELMGYPFPVQLKYDPWFIYSSSGVETWRRLNGSITNTTTIPVPTSSLHGITPASTFLDTSNTQAWWANYTYNWTVNNVDQSNTFHRFRGGSLCQVFYQDLTTSQSSRQIKRGDNIELTFNLRIAYKCTIAEDEYDPAVRIITYLTFADNNGNETVVTLDPLIGKLSDRSYTITYEVNQSSKVYLKNYRIEALVNPTDLIDYTGADPTAIYWFETTQTNDHPNMFILNVWHENSFMESVGQWFTNITNHISDLFVPNSAMIQNWVDNHASDSLDADNPLNLVKDLFVSLMDKFSGYNGNLQRPVIDVPALSFDIAGYGKVTPFEGYQWRLGSEGVVDGAGNNLWYYVKLATSIMIAAGLIGKMWSWFKKWYDSHYAGDGGSE